MIKSIKIKNAVEVLELYNPAALEALKKKFPSNAASMISSEMYGVGDNNENSGGLSLEGLVAFALDNLTTVKDRIAPNMEKLRIKLQRAKQLRLIAAILGSVASVGIIALILSNVNDIATLITAAINLTASLAIIFAGNMETPSIGGKDSLYDYFKNLNSLLSEVETLISKLKQLKYRGLEENEVLNLVCESDQVAFDLRSIERKL